MHRFFYDVINRDGDIVALNEEESRHAVRVLRLRPDSPIDLLDGEGHVYAAKIIAAQAERVEARITDCLPSHEPATRITLYQGLPKADKMEWIVQKCTELGVHAIQPVLFSRCDKEPGKNAEKGMLRLQRIMREAVKQCGRGQIPRLLPLEPFEAIRSRIGAHACSLVAWEEARGARIADVLAARIPTDVAVVIGPEGGITDQEADALRDVGAHLVTLGPRILRTETAGLVALTSILTIAGEL